MTKQSEILHSRDDRGGPITPQDEGGGNIRVPENPSTSQGASLKKPTFPMVEGTLYDVSSAFNSPSPMSDHQLLDSNQQSYSIKTEIKSNLSLKTGRSSPKNGNSRRNSINEGSKRGVKNPGVNTLGANLTSEWPMLFERAGKEWWKPRFDSMLLEQQYITSLMPRNTRRFQFGLIYILMLSGIMGIYSYIELKHWVLPLVSSIGKINKNSTMLFGFLSSPASLFSLRCLPKFSVHAVCVAKATQARKKREGGRGRRSSWETKYF